MSAPQPSHDRRRFRLATNDNETVVDDGRVAVDEITSDDDESQAPLRAPRAQS